MLVPVRTVTGGNFPQETGSKRPVGIVLRVFVFAESMGHSDVLAAITIETVLGIMVALNLIGMTFAAYVFMRRK